MNRQQRRKARRNAPQIERHPATGVKVTNMGSAELRKQLVADALIGYPEGESEAVGQWYLHWVAMACERIGRLDGIGTDGAFRQVREEIGAAGGFLPGAFGS